MGLTTGEICSPDSVIAMKVLFDVCIVRVLVYKILYKSVRLASTTFKMEENSLR
jgi:hypothetical protein